MRTTKSNGTTTVMKILKHKELEMLQFAGLNRHCDIFHFVTTRSGGVSMGPYASLNLGEYAGDDPETVRRNRALLSEATGIPVESMLAPEQVHGDRIYRVEGDFLTWPDERRRSALKGADALVTDVPGVCLAVSTADCVPVLLYAPDKRVVAAVHAGWRGTVHGIVSGTVRMMVETMGCDPAELQAGIGPSIGCEAFEVGEEVAEAFQKAGADMKRICRRSPRTGKPHIDLWEANRLQLLAAGLHSEHVDVAAICTYTRHETFFSARRLGVRSGRMWSGIFIRN